MSAVCGPILAGALIGADVLDTGWRMVFLINLSLVLLALAGAARVMPESRAAHAPRLDGGGMTLVTVGALLVFAQLGLHYSALRTGLAMAPWALGTALGAGLSGAVLGPWFGRRVLHGGLGDPGRRRGVDRDDAAPVRPGRRRVGLRAGDVRRRRRDGPRHRAARLPAPLGGRATRR